MKEDRTDWGRGGGSRVVREGLGEKDGNNSAPLMGLLPMLATACASRAHAGRHCVSIKQIIKLSVLFTGHPVVPETFSALHPAAFYANSMRPMPSVLPSVCTAVRCRSRLFYLFMSLRFPLFPLFCVPLHVRRRIHTDTYYAPTLLFMLALFAQTLTSFASA